MRALSKMLKMSVVLAVIASFLLSLWGCTPDENPEYERQVSRLIHQKQQLTTEKYNLANNMEKELGNTSYMSLVFTQLPEALYNEVYPVMAEGEVKLVGVMAFSENELPGLEGKITVEEYEELISVGWGNALYWNGETKLVDFLSDMQLLLGEIDVAFPRTVMFGPALYSTEYDAVLEEYGIENAIHDAEGDSEIVEDENPDGIWRPGCIGWRCIGISTRLKKFVQTNGGYALFEIAFNSENTPKNVQTSYFPIHGDTNDSNRTDVFVNMVNNFKSSIKEGEIEVFNVDDTRAKVARYYSEKSRIEAENAARSEEIDEMLHQLDRQITELYAKYH